MGKLDNSIVYLSGPMEKSKDWGVGWREEFKSKSKDLGIRILDPTDKPGDYVDEYIDDDGTLTHASTFYRLREDWESLRKLAKQFRRVDLRFCDISDFIVVYIDENVPTVGTWDEVITSERQQKPLLAIVNGGISRLPTWCFGIFELNCIFASVEECIEYLKGLDSGEIKLCDKWVLIRNEL